MVSQVSSILLRNFQTLYHQKLNLLCNIITPIMCLFGIWLVKVIVQGVITKYSFSVKLDIPIIFNVPFYSKLKYSNLTAKTTSCEEWYLYDFDNKSDTTAQIFFDEMMNSTSTLKYSCDNNPPQFNFSPYFQTPQNVQILENETDINTYLYDRAFELNYIDVEKLLREENLTKVPDGAITIKKLDYKNFEYKMQINDLRLPYYHRGNGVTMFYIYNNDSNAQLYQTYPSSLIGMVWSIGLFNRAYISKLYPNLTIVSGLQLMPIRLDDNEQNIQRYNIIIEKEKQLIEIMKINGLKMRNYWISNFIFNYIIYAITMVFFILFGMFVFSLNLFTETSFLLLFLTLFVWGFAQIGLAYFFQAFLSNARTTSVIGYLIAFWLILIGTCLNLAMFVIPKEAPYLLNLFPSFGIARIFYYMASFCAYDTCISEFSRVNTEVKFALLYLTIGGIILTILGVYLYEILPKKYGIRKGPFFCIEELFKECFKEKEYNELLIEENDEQENVDEIIGDVEKNDNLLTNGNTDEINTNTNKNTYEDNTTNDEEVMKEYKIVKELINKGVNELRKYPLVCNGLTKIYPSNLKSKDPKKRNKKSLNDFTIHLNDSEIFGLLGPNGAGKTTFFSILTGIYESTSGNAFIRGNSILKNIEKTYQYIGYCPQFDLLWEDLSVENTLLFYSRMKNKEKDKVYSMVEKILENVKLKKFRKYLVSELSGGMRRRLSLGVALVGECDRIGIILKGKIRCLGSQYKLKNNYGKGFKLCINLKPFTVEINKNDKDENMILDNKDEKIGFFFDKDKIKEQNRINDLRINKITNFLNEIFSKNCTLMEKHRSAVIYEIGSDVFNPELLFQKLEEKKTELEITNWAISQVDLEDIFIKLTENDL